MRNVSAESYTISVFADLDHAQIAARRFQMILIFFGSVQRVTEIGELDAILFYPVPQPC
jgi:hypothetical protein